jgi:putative ABC transport system permease protein
VIWSREPAISAGITVLARHTALLFGIGATDPVTYGVVAAVLAAIAALASWLPARRASRIAPVEALRWE